ncbi:MAG: histidine--tRNA ligase [Desulfurococcaceae archaeon]|jgi:histidyl-tRNA synthetase|nr:histidine--tRNA ligase [Desulfurococcaceae archaeon]
MRIKVEPVRGLRDVLPPESEVFRVLVNKFVSVVRSYGYQEVIPPTIELFELFATKSGPEISRSMYVFKDKAGREVCLRPELTASVVRIYIRSLLAEVKPIKLFYVGNAFRYEEPQLGRYREFTQVGVELIGDDSIYSDIELFLILRDYYRSLGLKEYLIKINDVGILRGLFNLWGINEDTQDLILHYMDKGLFDNATSLIRNNTKADLGLFNELTSIKTEEPEDLIVKSSSINLPEGISERVRRLYEVTSIIKKLGINKVLIDLSFARGLAYYTGLIFEITVPNLNISIGGGGRYDKLVELYGGPPTPATGFALGVERTYLALKNLGLTENLLNDVKVMIISLVNDYVYVDKVATSLRSLNYITNVRFVSKGRLGDLLGVASRKGYRYVVVIGEKEVSTGKVSVKDLLNRRQEDVEVDNIVKYFGGS